MRGLPCRAREQQKKTRAQKNAQKENRTRELQIEHASCKWSTRNGEENMRATNRARELQIEHAECQVEHANAVMTLMGHRIRQLSIVRMAHAQRNPRLFC